MATDKSAPALPKVGEVWVALDANPVANYPTMYEVTSVTPQRVGVDVLVNATINHESYTPAEWHRITKRAVRVDDKEAGR